MYAILDIENTGKVFQKEKIIEISIYRYDGERVTDKFTALINPEKPIDKFITKLTGISDDMVRRAPKFHEVAKRIIEITSGCILVAHNAANDYRVLRNEFNSLGYDYQRDILDTVNLSEKLIPGLDNYGLGRLCEAVGIPISARHRADGDAHATLRLFELLLEKDTDKIIIRTDIFRKEQYSKQERIEKLYKMLPKKPGIFYLFDKEGEIIYIGKGENMQKKLRNTLLKNSKRARKIRNMSVKCTYEITGCYTIAQLKFNQEIHSIKPKLNYIMPLSEKENVYTFTPSDILLLARGRKTGEKTVLLIENNQIIGYTYTDLERQYLNLAILKNKLIPLDNNYQNRNLMYKEIKKKKWKKIPIQSLNQNS